MDAFPPFRIMDSKMQDSEEQEVSFDFSDETPKSKVVKLPEGKIYLLKEASGGAVAKWRTAQMQGMTFGSDGKPTGSSTSSQLGDLQPLLISQCLYNEEGTKLVGIDVVRGISDRILSKLYDWIMEASDLKVLPKNKLREAEDALKNG